MKLAALLLVLVAIAAAGLAAVSSRSVASPPRARVAPRKAAPSAPPSVPRAAAGPIAAQPSPPAPPSTLAAQEAAFMRDLRALAELEPELAIERASEAQARFGDSEEAPERRSILIHALARAGRASEARGEAERMVNECPDSGWVREVERFTGAHRHRNLRLAENGQLEYE